MTNTGLDPEGLKTGGGGGGALTAEGMYRAAYAARGGEYERGFSSYKGVRGPSPGNFKTGLPESAFPCYFQVIFINLAG